MPHPRAADGGLLDQAGVSLQPLRQKKKKLADVVQHPPPIAHDAQRVDRAVEESRRKKTKGGGGSGQVNVNVVLDPALAESSAASARTSPLTEHPTCSATTETKNNGVPNDNTAVHVQAVSSCLDSAPREDDFITASIAEPAYYDAFRCAEEAKWRRLQAERSGPSSQSTVK